MYIGYCDNVEYFYTRVGGRVPAEPDLSDGERVVFKWQSIYNSGVEIHARLDGEYYVGSVTLPLLEGSRVCGVKLISHGSTVGVYSAGTGRTEGGEITVNAGVLTDEITLRIETSSFDVAFCKPRIYACRDDGAPLLWPVPKSVSFGEESVKISSISSGCEDSLAAAELLLELVSERFGDVICAEGVPVTLEISESDEYRGERYTVSVGREGIRLTAGKRIALMYAVFALLSVGECGEFRLSEIDNYPSKEYRGFHMGLPKPDNIPFAKHLMRDVLLPLGYNVLFVQIIGCMEFERHPEITEAWRRELARDPKFPHYYMGAEGGTISRAEVAELMDYAHGLGFEIIPEVQSLGHVQWLTIAHPEIAEIAPEEREIEDTRNEDERPVGVYHHCYCPSDERSYELLFDVMDEIIEVTRPERFVHIGHDEVYHIGLCERCRELPADVLFARDVKRIYDHLRSRGLRTMMWSDMLQPVSQYRTPAAIKLIPKDIVMLDFIWYFHLDKNIEENLYPEGFDVLIGNLYSSHFPRYTERARAKQLRGGAVSSWCEVNEYRMGKKGKFWELSYTAELLWNPESYRDEQRRVFSYVISHYLQPLQRDLVRGKYCIGGYEKSFFSPSRGKVDGIPREILARYPGAVIADGSAVVLNDKFDRLLIEHTALVREMRVPWTELRLSGEYTLCYDDGDELTVRAEYGGGVMFYDSSYGHPLPEAVHRHTGYIGTWFSDPVFEGKGEHGEDLLVLAQVVENPYPNKTLKTVIYKSAENDISTVVLCGIEGLKGRGE